MGDRGASKAAQEGRGVGSLHQLPLFSLLAGRRSDRVWSDTLRDDANLGRQEWTNMNS